jgi:transcriptional regulator with XRE-family HTH domain
MTTVDSTTEPVTARGLFGAELRRLRLARGVSQDQLAAMVLHSRGLVAAVELGERWPPRDLADRCDEVLHGCGVITRLWPLVDQERRGVRRIVAEVGSEVRVADLRELVLRPAMLTGADLSVLSVPDSGQDEAVEVRQQRSE